VTAGLIVGSAGVVLVILVPLVGFAYKRYRTTRKYYEFTWKDSASLKPEEILRIRGKPETGYRKYYHEREIDRRIKEKLQGRKNVVITGDPLAGKTRAIYHALTTSHQSYNVIMVTSMDVNPEEFRIPFRLTWWRRSIVVIDEIEKCIEKQNFDRLLRRFLDSDTLIIASCRCGPEYDKLHKQLETEFPLVFSEPLEIPRLLEEEAKQIAKEAEVELAETFDGNIGSLFLPLEAMKERYKDSNKIEQAVLRSVKRLYYAGVFEGRNTLDKQRITQVCEEVEGIRKQPYEWTSLLAGLENKGFVEVGNGEVQIEETYFESVVEGVENPIDNLEIVVQVFLKDPKALIEVGNRGYQVGLVDVRKAEYMEVAIRAYTEALKVYTLDRFPIQYATTQNNLGAAYQTLAEVEDTAENCNRAIAAHKEALKVHTLDRFPIQYARAQSNLGAVYGTIAGVEDKAENCNRAIAAHKEALKVHTLDRSPMDYAMTQSNLGAAYRTLAEVEDKAENCNRAIAACEEALKVYTLDRFPIQYAAAQNNLGGAYQTLAEVEDTAENCNRAIAAHKEALKVHTLDRIPIQYAMTQSNLGDTYRTLAEVENKAENCNRAIAACKEALKVHTLDRFPIQYAMTQSNLGDTYRTLAEVEDKAENCNRAIAAYEEALNLLQRTAMRGVCDIVSRNLEKTLRFCGRE
jgi:tetratricopeptide (TPR) repeat protein